MEFWFVRVVPKCGVWNDNLKNLSNHESNNVYMPSSEVANKLEKNSNLFTNFKFHWTNYATVFINIHPALVLCCSCVPEKVDIHKKDINQQDKQCTYNVTLRHIHVTTVAKEKK